VLRQNEKDLKELFMSALDVIHLGNEDVVQTALDKVKDQQEKLEMRSLGRLLAPKYRSHLAWALFCALKEHDIHRSPLDIALLLGVEKKKFSAAQKELCKAHVMDEMQEAAASLQIGTMCECLGFSWKFRCTAVKLCESIEADYFTHKRELFIYHLILEMISLLPEGHRDKHVVDETSAVELKYLLRMRKNYRPHHIKLPWTIIVQMMLTEKLI